LVGVFSVMTRRPLVRCGKSQPAMARRGSGADSIPPVLFSSSRLAPKVMLWANKVTGNTQIDSETQRFQRSRSTPQERFCEPVSVSYRTGLRHA
jgi:hypothetical protein